MVTWTLRIGQMDPEKLDNRIMFLSEPFVGFGAHVHVQTFYGPSMSFGDSHALGRNLLRGRGRY